MPYDRACACVGMLLLSLLSVARLQAQEADETMFALGVIGMAKAGHVVEEEGTGATYGESGAFVGIGAEVRVLFGNSWSASLLGDYMPKSNEGVVHEAYDAGAEVDFFFTPRGAARLYLGAIVGAEQTVYHDPAGGPSLRATRVMIGPAGGGMIPIERHILLGLGAEYRVGGAPYIHEYGNGGDEGPSIDTPGRFVARARLLWLF